MKWEEMISAFQRLGGIAENVCQKRGIYGRGIFPINPKLPSRISVPKHLMVSVESVVLDDGAIRIREGPAYSREFCDFFDQYQENFSWGNGGREEVENFEAGLRSLPEHVKKFLNQCGISNLKERHEGSWDEVIFRRFIKTRCVYRGNQSPPVLSPVWELMNHGVLASRFVNHHEISSFKSQHIRGELLTRYVDSSPVRILLDYGIPSAERYAFSFPLQSRFLVGGKRVICKGESFLLDNSSKIESSADIIILESVLIGNSVVPQQPLLQFQAQMEGHMTHVEAEKVFRLIAKTNRQMLSDLVEVVRELTNPTGSALQEAASREIALIDASCH
jgi:hypothetical protein